MDEHNRHRGRTWLTFDAELWAVFVCVWGAYVWMSATDIEYV